MNQSHRPVLIVRKIFLARPGEFYWLVNRHGYLDRLTDEILFGELENGGTVTIDAADDKLTFAFQPRADEPQPHPAK